MPRLTTVLLPIPVDRTSRRAIQLTIGLVLYGVSMAMQIRAALGLSPWDVFHQGLAGLLPLSFGAVVALVGAVVLLLWWPLRQRPGIGTVANVVLIAIAVDAGLALIPQVSELAIRIPLLLGGVVLNGVASALYIGVGFGPGPRDGLMTGLVRRTGRSIRLIRTLLEVTVLTIGWLLGGDVGVGTVVYALGIGPLVHFFLPKVTVPVTRVAGRS